MDIHPELSSLFANKSLGSKLNRKLLLSSFTFAAFFLISLSLSMSGVLAVTIDAHVDRDPDRIYTIPGANGNFFINITVRNLDGATAVSGLNITLPQGFNVTNADSSISGNTLTCRNISNFDANVANGAGAGGCLISSNGGNTIDIVLGSTIAAGGTAWFRLGTDGTTGTIFASALQGAKNFTVQATDASGVLSTTNVFVLALSNGGIGFDVRNTTTFPKTVDAARNKIVQPNALVRLILTNNSVNSNHSIKVDSNGTGILFWPSSEVTSLQSSTSNFSYTISSGTNPLRAPNKSISYAGGSVNKDTIDDPIQVLTAANQTLSVSVFDELGKGQTVANISVYASSDCGFGTLIAFNQTSTSRNFANFSITPAIALGNVSYFVRAEKVGYVQTNCTNVTITNAGGTTQGGLQYNLTFSGTLTNYNSDPSSSATTAGMNYTAQVSDVTDQLGSPFTIASANTTFQGFSTLTSAGFSSAIVAEFSGGDAFLNLTGSGTLLINTTGYVKINATGTVTPNKTIQTKISFLNSSRYTAGNRTDVTGAGLPFMLRVSAIQDEVGNALSQAAIASDNVTTFNGNAGYNAINNTFDPVSGNWYAAVANNTGYVIRYNKTGYVLNNATQINTSSDSQTNITFINTTGTSFGLQPVLKLRIQDELSQDIFTTTQAGSNISFNINLTGWGNETTNSRNFTAAFSPNATQFGFAYFALHPDNYTSIFVLANKTGYIQTNSSVKALSWTSQAVDTVKLPFALKLSRIEDELGFVLSGASSDRFIFYNGTGTSSGTATAINTTLSSGIWFIALEEGPYNITLNKTGYIIRNNTGSNVTINDTNQSIALSYINDPNGLNFSVRVAVEDEFGTILGMDGANTSFWGFYNVSAVNFSTDRLTAYIPAAQNISAFLRANVTGYVSTNTSGRLVLNSTEQAFANFSYNKTGGLGTGTGINGTGLNFTLKINIVRDELGTEITQAAADKVTLFAPGGASVRGLAANNLTLVGAQWRIAAPEAASYIIGYDKDGYISKNDTASASPDYVTNVNYTVDSNALNFSVKVNVFDELNRSTGMSDNVTFKINGPIGETGTSHSPNASSSNSYYFSLNQSQNPHNISVWRAGYVIRNGTTDPGLGEIAVNNVTQTIINLTSGARCADAAIGNSTTQRCGGLNFSLVVSAQDELGTGLFLTGAVSGFNTTTFLGSDASATANLRINQTLLTFSEGRAYIPANSTGIGDNLEINHTGYVRTNTTNRVTTNITLFQQNITYVSGGSGSGVLFPVRVGITKTTADQAINATVYVTTGSTIHFTYPTANRTNTTHGNYFFPVNISSASTVNVSAQSGFKVANNTGSSSVSNAAQLGLYLKLDVDSDTGRIDGYVLTNATTAVAISGASATDGTRTATTNNNGYYLITNVPAGTYTVTASASGHTTNSTSSVSVTVGSTTRANVTMASTSNGTIDGYILTNATTPVAITGATASDGTRTATSNSVGYYLITGVPAGSYTVTGTATGHLTNTTASVVVTVGANTRANVTLASVANGTINGYVITNVTFNAIAGAVVSDGTRTATSNSAGFFQLTNVPPATYTLTASKSGFATNTTTSVSVSVGGSTQANVTMTANDTTSPVITIVSPSNSTNVTSTTPLIKFVVTDAGSGIDMSDSTAIAVNVTGLSLTRDCTNAAVGALNTTCEFRVTGGLTDARNATVSIAVRDIAGNAPTNTSLMFGVDTTKGINFTLNTSDTSGIADNSYGNGWSFTFNVSLGSAANATRIRMTDFSRIGGSETFAVSNNVRMNYTTLNGSQLIYNVRNAFNETEAVAPLYDFDSNTAGVQSSVTVFVRIPASAVAGTYTTTIVAGTYSVAEAGG